VAVRLLIRREPRLWPLLGLIAGVGLEAKYTIALLILAFAAAFTLTAERHEFGEPLAVARTGNRGDAGRSARSRTKSAGRR
jgi:Dolichyl-phosphate-mannose-protein mannosyltransferase